MRLMSAVGLLAFMLLASFGALRRPTVNGRLIVGALALQIVFGWFVFRSAGGRQVFLHINDGVNAAVTAALAGPRFVLGKLADGEALNKAGLGPFILITQGLPTIMVFSALIAVLYYFGVMSALLRAFAWLFSRSLRVSGAEALCAAANIFVGIESALTVRPYLSAMTRSELCVVLSAGMATVASNVLALYVGALHDVFPNIAGHLVSASFLSAPAAILMAKLICPETDSPLTLGVAVAPAYEREGSLFEAIINGAEAGLKMMLGI
ncbi:MAG: nucleoside transporter, partial [Planctomycetota bacterium]|nr:nucleoside transporter [Planctomycetota bacterium]